MLLLLVTTLAAGLCSLVAGMHLTGHFVLNPPLRALGFGHYVTMKHLLDRDAPKLAKPLMQAALAVTALALVAALITARPAAAIALVVALVALALTLTAILRGDLPINRVMAGWSDANQPADWTEVRARWERYFLIRVITSAVATVAALAAVFLAAAPY